MDFINITNIIKINFIMEKSVPNIRFFLLKNKTYINREKYDFFFSLSTNYT